MSLRLRLLLGMAAVAVVLVMTSWSMNRATERTLVDQVDQQLERNAPRALGGAYDPDRDRDREEERGGPPSSAFVGVVDTSTGTIRTLFTADAASETEGAPELSAAEALDRVGGAPFTVGAEDSSGRYRAVVRTFEARPGDGTVVVVYASPLEDVDEAIERLVTIQLLAGIAILATLGLVTFWVLRLGVRPVREMTDTAQAIGEGDLSQRIPESDPGTEAGQLGIALNQMLGRIEEAFDERTRSEDRLRQFVADASHELRTPITTIRGYAELYRMGGLGDEHALGEAMRRTEQEATRMGQLVGDLLSLARLDEGRALRIEALDLDRLASDAVADARAVEPARPISLVSDGPAPFRGDEALIRQVLANLVANVRVHTEPDDAVEVRVRHTEATVAVEVADQGPGMAPDVAARVFERFYRADPARARHTGGSGLGLSIVASAVAAHGGTASVESAPGAGTTIRVELPVDGPPPAGAANAQVSDESI